VKKPVGIPGKSRRLTHEENRERVRIVVDLVRMKDRLARVGLFKTMHALDTAVNQVGYEHAEDVRKWSKGEKDFNEQKVEWYGYMKEAGR
jgi:hypothetical protein